MTRRTRVREAQEHGIAMVLALFMMLAVSVLGTSLMFVSNTETLSSHNYRLMSQARYGAESGLHTAANYLLSTGYGAMMPGSAGDPLANYNLTVSPVTLVSNGRPVVLSYDSTASNYPIAAVKTQFADAAEGELDVDDAPVRYKATATLKSMKQISDAFTGLDVVIQTWDIAAAGEISGARNAVVEVSAVMERQTSPIYSYAAFSTDPGCASMTFGGGGKTNSFNSNAALGANGKPVISDQYGDVGTNGNLTASGSNNTVINGSLSTPRTGVGACTSSNVTAETINGQATVTGGLVQLSQSVSYPTPPLPATLPPVGTTVMFQGACPTGLADCGMSTVPGVSGGPYPTLSPSGVMTLSEVKVNATSTLVLKGGDYTFNSFEMEANSKIVVYPGSGDVRINIVGKNADGTYKATPLKITGQGIVNTDFNPTELQFIYAGTGEIQLAGGDNTAALMYAPNATGRFTGGADLYGAVVVKQLTDLGGAEIHYDVSLKNDAMTAGNYMLSAFTWKNY